MDFAFLDDYAPANVAITVWNTGRGAIAPSAKTQEGVLLPGPSYGRKFDIQFAKNRQLRDGDRVEIGGMTTQLLNTGRNRWTPGGHDGGHLEYLWTDQSVWRVEDDGGRVLFGHEQTGDSSYRVVGPRGETLGNLNIALPYHTGIDPWTLFISVRDRKVNEFRQRVLSLAN